MEGPVDPHLHPPSTAKMIQDHGWLPRLFVGWEMPACFYPRVQLNELRLLGAHSDRLYWLCFLLIWCARSSVLWPCSSQFSRWSSALRGRNKRVGFLFICVDRLLTSSLHVLPASCIAFTMSFSFDKNRAQSVPDFMSLMRYLSCTENFMLRCTWGSRSVSSASISSFAAPPPDASCFFPKTL